MRNLCRVSLLLAILVSLVSLAPVRAQSNIQVQVKGLADSALVLGYYFTDGRYVADSAWMDAKGHATFHNDSTWAQGLYFVMLPGYQILDVMLGPEQNLTITVDPKDLLQSATIKGSKLSADFLEYQRFMFRMQTENRRVAQLDSTARAEKPDKPESSASYTKARELGKSLDDQVHAYQKQVLTDHADDLLGKFCQSTIPVEIPDYEPPASIKNRDSARWMHSYRYNIEHHLDNVDLAYVPLLRTPTTMSKVDHYLDKVLLQLPDTINRYCDRILDRAAQSPDAFRVYLSHLFTKYQTSEIIGMDAVFVHLAERYYLSGRADWIDDDLRGKIQKRVDALKPNLLGKVAPDFTVERLTGGTFQLSKSKAPATVIVFWEPSCSHCKVAIPKIDSVAKIYEPKGLLVVAFMTQGDGPAWQKYVEEHKLQRWINVWDPYRKSKFSDNYDIYSTPVIYVLDEEHKIFIKRIGVEHLGPVLEDLFKTRKK